jgi:hypothetical protein
MEEEEEVMDVFSRAYMKKRQRLERKKRKRLAAKLALKSKHGGPVFIVLLSMDKIVSSVFAYQDGEDIIDGLPVHMGKDLRARKPTFAHLSVANDLPLDALRSSDLYSYAKMFSHYDVRRFGYGMSLVSKVLEIRDESVVTQMYQFCENLRVQCMMQLSTYQLLDAPQHKDYADAFRVLSMVIAFLEHESKKVVEEEIVS